MPRPRYDLIVLGSGPAGQKAALNAAELGKRVAIVDRTDCIGGACTHTGTIPSKAIREAVLHLTALRERSVYGQSYAVKQNISMADLLHRANHVIRCEVEVIRAQMARNDVDVIYGTAAFTSPDSVRVSRSLATGSHDHIDLAGDRFLIAVGTEPARPSHIPFTPGRVIDSNDLLLLPALPRTLLVVGGGVIGCEYACMFAAAGVGVTLVDSKPRLLDFIDDELTENLQYRMRDMGIRLRLGESVANVDVTTDGTVETRLASNKTLRAETVLFAAGRQGATAHLNLQAAGLQADQRGRLAVNEYFQTAVPHVYAAGDVIGFPALAATSMEQGRLASSYMFRQLVEPVSPLYPIGVYTIPEISMIGQTEQALTQAGTPYEVGQARYRDIARGQLIADPQGLLKLLFHPHSRRLLGAHAIGTGATELIHLAQAVMTAGLPIDYFVETVFNYPTLAECYKVAAQDGVNRARRPTETVLPPAQAA